MTNTHTSRGHKPNATRSAVSFICQRFAQEPKRGGLEFRYRVFQNLCFSDTLKKSPLMVRVTQAHGQAMANVATSI